MLHPDPVPHFQSHPNRAAVGRLWETRPRYPKVCVWVAQLGSDRLGILALECGGTRLKLFLFPRPPRRLRKSAPAGRLPKPRGWQAGAPEVEALTGQREEAEPGSWRWRRRLGEPLPRVASSGRSVSRSRRSKTAGETDPRLRPRPRDKLKASPRNPLSPSISQGEARIRRKLI